MYEDMVNRTTASLEKLLEPAMRLNALMLSNAEKAVSLQIEAARRYTDMSLRHVREGAEIRDAEGFQAYVASHQSRAQAVIEAIQADARALADLQTELGTEVKRVVDDGLQALAPERPKAAARKTTARSNSATRKTGQGARSSARKGTSRSAGGASATRNQSSEPSGQDS